MPTKPHIDKITPLASTRIFNIEAVDLTFSNGAHAQFERINSPNDGAVMVIPIHQDSLIMVREYAVGREQYELGFVKGLIDKGETPEQAADRELKEEIGFGAKNIQPIRKVRLVPHYNTAVAYLFLASDLYAEQKLGDEPEALEQIKCPLNDLDSLLNNKEISDVRTLYALYWLRDHLNKFA